MTVEQWLGKDNKLGIDIHTRKYPKKTPNHPDRVETFDEWLDRVSLGDPLVRKLIMLRIFIPGGRILSNVTLKNNSVATNCYSIGYVPDDYREIMQTMMNIGLTFKAQGGEGLSLSKLRPKGSPIKEQYQSDGIIPFMKMFNEVTAGTSQGGARKGALLMSLDAWHKEIMNFITIKSQDGLIEKANLSLEIDDEFMKCVDTYYKTGEVITVKRHENYSGHEVEWEITPIEVFKAFIHNNYDWGDPGCLFVNRFRNYNLMEYCDEYQIETCNPCGEQPLNKHGACNLGSINLSELVIDPYTDKARFDYENFYTAVQTGIEYLDKIIDINADNHPLSEQRENSLNFRNCGLGVFGYATMLMKLGMKYGSPEAIDFTDEIFDKMFRTAVQTSNRLAKYYGTFPKYNPNIWKSHIITSHFDSEEIEEMKQYGLRNCSLLSIAPTGSISSMLNESSGCEPEFALSYTRRTVGLTDNEDHYYTVDCKAAREYKQLYSDNPLPDYFVSSADIDPYDRIKTQAVMQNHVDTAISSTINLPEYYTEEDMAKIYLEAWKQGLKGLTIFRSGCKKQAILTTGNPENSSQNISNNLQRGEWKQIAPDTTYYKRKIKIGCGKLNLFIGWSDKEQCVQELWVKRTGQGGCEMNIQACVITMSGMLRLGGNIFNIEKAFDGLGACNSFVSARGKGKTLSKGSSCATAILNEIKAFLKEKQGSQSNESKSVLETKLESTPSAPKISQPTNQTITNSSAICPECGEPLVFEGGCNSCKNCGYSKCN